MNTVRPHTEDEIYDLLKQALDAMKLHTAETHPIVETERAMEMIEAELAQPAQEPLRREQQLFMDEQAFYAYPKDTDDLIQTGQLPRALRLANTTEFNQYPRHPDHSQHVAAELRRLHAENEQLKAQPQTMRPAELAERLKRGEKWAVGQERQPLTTDEYVQALGPLLSQIVCSSGTLRCIVRTIEAKHGIKEQP